MTYYSNAGLQVTRSRKLFLIAAAAVVGVTLALTAILQPASALATVTVRPSDTQGWMSGAPLAETRSNGEVSYVADADTTFGEGALSLVTGDATASPSQDKAQYMHASGVALADVTDLSYSSKTLAGPVHAAPSYQLAVDLNGDAIGGFTTFVYEPYQNGTPSITTGAWYNWDVDAGQFWSSRGFTDGAQCTVTAGAGGTFFYSLADLQDNCPDAVVVAFGVNVGSNNPNWDTRVDGVAFNDTVYDFEQNLVAATDKNQCKDEGWMNFQADYRNQGQCVAAVVSSENSKHNRQ